MEGRESFVVSLVSADNNADIDPLGMQQCFSDTPNMITCLCPGFARSLYKVRDFFYRLHVTAVYKYNLSVCVEECFCLQVKTQGTICLFFSATNLPRFFLSID
jgi:hypothetical protein